MNDENDRVNPATGSIMSGSADADGNLYGHGGTPYYIKFAKEDKAEKPYSDDEFAHRLLAIVCMFSFFFILFVIGCSLK